MSKNPYKLLKPYQLLYEPTHLVEDCRADISNLLYDNAYKRSVPAYFVMKNALSVRYKVLPINTSGELLSNSQQIRYFDGRILKQLYNAKLEKKFRKKTLIPTESSDVIPISHVRYATDDEGVNYFFILLKIRKKFRFIFLCIFNKKFFYSNF